MAWSAAVHISFACATGAVSSPRAAAWRMALAHASSYQAQNGSWPKAPVVDMGMAKKVVVCRLYVVNGGIYNGLSHDTGQASARNHSRDALDAKLETSDLRSMTVGQVARTE